MYYMCIMDAHAQFHLQSHAQIENFPSGFPVTKADSVQIEPLISITSLLGAQFIEITSRFDNVETLSTSTYFQNWQSESGMFIIMGSYMFYENILDAVCLRP